MDFAPYQDTSPETQRTLSPPPQGRRSASFSPTARSPAAGPISNPWAARVSSPPAHNHHDNDGRGSHDAPGLGGSHDVEAGGRSALDEFATSLPMRLDYEACLAYLLLPPVGGVFLLVVERKSDYVRYVLGLSLAVLLLRLSSFARSSKLGHPTSLILALYATAVLTDRAFLAKVMLMSCAMFIVHLLFSWSTILSWIIFVVDLGLIGYLTYRAYLDADTLDRFEVPFFGPLASRFLDDE
ncbi:MAG: hypothetical protein M1818_005247 [Claussenomyces sp. TS43310]|nr:MAG: hypothetical protein M1818_005247 [Claussenomyces sp. TS43310]